MRIWLDEDPCEVDARTVGQAIDAAAAIADGKGRLIVEVVVDDTPWSAGDLDIEGRLDQVAKEVRMMSADPGTLVIEAFRDTAAVLTEADSLQQEAARQIQADHRTEAMESLARAVDIWMTLQETVLKGAEAVGLNLDEVRVDDSLLSDSIARLNDWLLIIRNALSDGDQIALADTLAYEMPRVVKSWQSILEELITLVEGSGRTPT